MSSINEILSIGKGGMSISKAMLAVAGKNMANVNTPGYSREILQLSTSQFAGLGVSTSGPFGVRNPILADSLRNAMGEHGFFKGQLVPLSAIEPAVNDLDGTGLGQALATFQGALQEMAANPASDVERTALLSSAEFLVQSFRTTSKQLGDSAEKTRDQAQVTSEKITEIAKDIAELNQKISVLINGVDPPNTLIDKRGSLLEELSGLIGIDVLDTKDGSVSVFVAGGRPLVDHTLASSVDIFPADPPPGTPVAITVTKPNGQVMDPIGKTGGELGGLLQAHNETIIPGIQELDELAHAMISEFNAIHQVGFGVDGSTGLNFFDPLATAQGAASLIAVSSDVSGEPQRIAAATDPLDVPGDNTNLLAMINLQGTDGVLPSGESIENGWFDIMLRFGSAISDAKSGQETEQATMLQISNILASETAVSIDEELISMNEANQAFDAAGALIRAAEEMSRTLINLVG